MSGPVVSFDADAIPDELKERDQWLQWDTSADTPRRPHWNGDFTISWSDPDAWHSFEEAKRSAELIDSWGIGYVMALENADFDGEYGCIDIDNGLDENGRPKEWLPDLTEFIESGAYIERSPSGTGLHIPVIGYEPPPWWADCQRGDHEGVDYLTNKFCTFTGDTIDVSGSDVYDGDCGAWFWDAYKAVKGESPPIDHLVSGETATASGDHDEWLTDEHIQEALERINPDLAYKEWVSIGYAVHDYDPSRNGKQLFESWSRKGSKWDGQAQRVIEDLWSRAKPGNGITVATLVHKAKSNGWTPKRKEKETRRKQAPDEVPEGDNPAELSQVSVEEIAGVESVTDLNDREKAYWVAKLIERSDDYHVIATQPDGEIYRYNEGVWTPDGEQYLRELGDKALGAAFGTKTHRELCDKIRARSPKQRGELGTPKGTVAVANGLLELDTRELRDLRPRDYAITRLPVEYDPDADCPRWDTFIQESVEADRREAVQEYVGYTLLTNELPYERVLLLVGEGANGKSTFLNVVTELLGPENTTGYSLQKLSKSEYYVANMFGSIANIDADVGDKIYNIETFKKLTGGDRKVDARKPYGEPFEFHPTTKQLYAANVVPEINEDTTAVFRRWLIVEFPTVFTDRDLPGPDKDPGLENDLLGELSGILNWALDGLDRLTAQGKFTNEGTTEEKRERWQTWGDSVDRFISECVDTEDTEGDGKYRTSDAYDRYKAWCEANGETPETQNVLTTALKKVDGVKYSSSFRFDGKQERGFKGLSFTSDTPTPESGEDTGYNAQLPQGDAIDLVYETVCELAEDEPDGAVSIQRVAKNLNGALGGRDPEHYIDKLKERDQLTEAGEGRVRSV